MTSEGFRTIRSRLGAARAVLESCKEATHAAISSTQSAAVLAMIARHSNGLDAEDRASLTTLAAQVGWHGTDGGPILQSLMPSCAGKPTRPPMQNFLSFLKCYTEKDWGKLLNDNLSNDARLTTLFFRPFQLSLRFPSEPTFKRFAAVHLTLTEAPEALAAMSVAEKGLALKLLKKAFQQMLGRNPPTPGVLLERLPDTPQELQSQHLTLFREAYGDESPVHCKLDLLKLAEVELPMKCRNTGLASTAAAPIQTLNLGPSSQFQEVANFFMNGMQNQERMLQLMMPQQHQQSGPHLRSFAALADANDRLRNLGGPQAPRQRVFSGHDSDRLALEDSPSQNEDRFDDSQGSKGIVEGCVLKEGFLEF